MSSTNNEPFLKLEANSKNSYLVDCGLRYEQFRQSSLTPSGRFLFFPGIRSMLYEFLDLINAKLSGVQLKNSDVFSMRRYKIFPLDDYSVLIVGYTAASLNKSFLDYQSAVYELKRNEANPSSNQLQTITWKPVAKIPSKQRRLFFQVNTRVYLMCMNTQRLTNLHYFDLDRCGKFVKNFAVFTTKINLPAKRLERFTEFMTYNEGHIYAFKRLSKLCNRCKTMRTFVETYSRILQINTENGRSEVVPLSNLDSMKVPANTYSQESVFEIDGKWCNEFFYIHLKIRIPTSAKHPIHYFAVLNLANLTWSSLQVSLPPNRTQCPLKLIVNSDNVMILLQFHNTPKRTASDAARKNPMHRCREHAKLYKVNYYRMPIRQPESLRILSQIAYNKMIAIQTEQNKQFIKERCANIVIQPVY